MAGANLKGMLLRRLHAPQRAGGGLHVRQPVKFALVNPNWTFDASIYFGCRQPHLPLELGYARALLEAAGHEALTVDGHLFDLSSEDIRAEVAAFGPDFTVVTARRTTRSCGACRTTTRGSAPWTITSRSTASSATSRTADLCPWSNWNWPLPRQYRYTPKLGT